MNLNLEITHDSPGDQEGITRSLDLDLASGDHLALEGRGDIRITRDGEAPGEITPVPGGVELRWEDGFHVFIDLTPVPSDEEGEDGQPREVSINGQFFGIAGDDNSPIDDFMKWAALYDDHPLPWEPLPPYQVPFPEFDDDYDRVKLEEEEAAQSTGAPVTPGTLPAALTPGVTPGGGVPGGGPDFPSGPPTEPPTLDYALSIEKTVSFIDDRNQNELTDADDVIHYTITVSNTGTETLTNVVVNDPLLGGTLATIPSLAPGASQDVLGSYTITQDDLDNSGENNAGDDGDIDNTAIADSTETDPVDDSEEVDLDIVPALAIDKEVTSVTDNNDNGFTDAGDVINYTITVTNTGNQTLTNVVVNDPLLSGTPLATIPSLAPGASQDVLGSYTIAQDDIDNTGTNNAGSDGDIDNIATADSTETDRVDDSEEVDLDIVPALAIDKEVTSVTDNNDNGFTDAGDGINYTITVTNTGNQTLTNVVVNDPLLSGTPLATIPSLAPGASQDVLGSYLITQNDADNTGTNNAGPDGDIDNIATADSDQTEPVSDDAEVPITGDGPAISEVAANVAVDEEGLLASPVDGPAAIGDLAGTATIVSGTLGGLDFGFSGPGDIVLDAEADTGLTTLAGNSVSSSWNGTTHTLTGSDSVTGAPVFTVQITDVPTGAYTYTQVAPLKHAVSGLEDDATFSVTVTVTDAGSGSASGSIDILIDDDSPTATDATTAGTVDEDGVPGGIADGPGDVAGEVAIATGSVSSLFTAGADSPLIYSLGSASSLAAVTSGGIVLVYAVTGNTLTATAGGDTVFTFEINKGGVAGAWEFKLESKLDHPTLDGLTGDDTENDLLIDLSSIVVATDADGDPVTAAENSVVITVDDDTPLVDAQESVQVANTPAATVDGTLNLNGGADNANVVTITGETNAIGQALDASGDVLTSDGSPIYYIQIGGVLHGVTDLSNPGTTGVFTISPDVGSNSYTVTMIGTLDAVTETFTSNFGTTDAGGPDDPYTSAFSAPGGDTQTVHIFGFGAALKANASTDGLGVGGGTGGASGGNLVNNGEEVGSYYVGAAVTAVTLTVGNFSTAGQDDGFDWKAININETLFDIGSFLDPGSATDYTLEEFLDSFELVGTVLKAKLTEGGPFTTIGTVVAGGSVAPTATTESPNTAFILAAPSEFNFLHILGTGEHSSSSFKIVEMDIEVELNEEPLVANYTVASIDGDGDTTADEFQVSFGGTPTATPVVLDVDGDGLEFLGISDGVAFDYDGDGTAESTAWAAPDDGILVHDANGDGVVNDGSEIAFSQAHPDAHTDLEGLALAFDTNEDSQLDAQDEAYASFGVWQDADSNGVTDAGEFSSLSEAGIVSIDLLSDGLLYEAAGGDVIVFGEATYLNADGTTGTVGDVAFATGESVGTVEAPALDELVDEGGTVEELLPAAEEGVAAVATTGDATGDGGSMALAGTEPAPAAGDPLAGAAIDDGGGMVSTPEVMEPVEEAPSAVVA